MSSPNCWRCLLRAPSLPFLPKTTTPTTTLSVHRFFSTTPAILAPPLKAKKPIPGARTTPLKGEKKSLRIKKKRVAAPAGRPPAPGERKAMRKRVVLSNTNALDAKIPDLTPDVGPEMVGKVVGFPGEVVDGLRALEAFKATQGWGMFRRPGVLVREESVRVVGLLRGVEEGRGTVRRVWVGERGGGKSVMLLWAMAVALLRGWVVVSIPEAQDLTNAHTAYSPLRPPPGTTTPSNAPTTYIQKEYTSTLLARLLKANPILTTLPLHLPHPTFPAPLPPTTTLSTLATLGIRDPDIAWPTFLALWDEITAPASAKLNAPPRPPVLLALDGLAHVMRESEYRDARFERIHAHDLALVRHFATYLSGSRILPNGGAVLAATSRSNSPSTPTLDFALSQRTGGAVVKDPFVTYDSRVLSCINEGVDVVPVKGLDRAETRGLLEYFAKCGVLRGRVDEGFVAEVWAVGGSGVVGEVVRGGVMGARV